MSRSEYLFPNRLNRRNLLALGAAAAASTVAPRLWATDSATPVKIGEGPWTYTLDESWGVLPAGMKYGNGCGIVVDSQDRIYVTSRSDNPCVAIFDRDGKLAETWSKDFGDKIGYTPDQIANTAHGIFWSKEGNDDFLYFTENAGKGRDGKPAGRRVYKTDLQGKVLYTLGNVEADTPTTQKFEWTNPTDVAVAANGDIYVVDGYGSQRMSRFDKNFKHIKTIGERGKEHGQFNTCHGVWVSMLRGEPEVYIADRHNDRVEVFSPELEYKRTISGDFIRQPCCFYQHAGHTYIPDLKGLVSIMDRDDKNVAVLGDKALGTKDAPDRFQAPHALTVDSKGNLYVLEWVEGGRVRKYAHTPA